MTRRSNCSRRPRESTQKTFEAARTKLTSAIQLWQQLPERASSELLRILGGLDPAAIKVFRQSLDALTNVDESKQRAGLLALLSEKDFDATPTGELLLALADTGLLNLLDRLPEVRRAASVVADILDGDVIRRLQNLLAESLDLNKVIEVCSTQTDFESLLVSGRAAGRVSRPWGQLSRTSMRFARRLTLSWRSGRRFTTRCGRPSPPAMAPRSQVSGSVQYVEDRGHGRGVRPSAEAGANLMTALLREGL